jgi:hypothetical protein
MIATRPPIDDASAEDGKTIQVPLSDKRAVCSGLEPENEARTPWIAAIFTEEVLRLNKFSSFAIMEGMISFGAAKTFSGKIFEKVNHELAEKKSMRRLISNVDYLGTTLKKPRMNRLVSFEKFINYPKKNDLAHSSIQQITLPR